MFSQLLFAVDSLGLHWLSHLEKPDSGTKSFLRLPTLSPGLSEPMFFNKFIWKPIIPQDISEYQQQLDLTTLEIT